MTTTITATETDEVLAGMLTENTGRHFLDSGGAYGRNWERNQGKSVQDFLDSPDIYWDGYCVSLDLFHFLRNRIEFDSDMTAQFLGYCDERPDDSWYECAEDFVAQFTKNPRGWNSYNDVTCLSQDVQWWEFPVDGEDDSEKYVLLQIHGGCDARGGYTKPQVFRAHESWYYDASAFEASFSVDVTTPQIETLPGFDDTPPYTLHYGYQSRFGDEDCQIHQEINGAWKDLWNVPIEAPKLWEVLEETDCDGIHPIYGQISFGTPYYDASAW